jgi:succinate dehydrogenase / fumarate reductase, flavoprotein subunit
MEMEFEDAYPVIIIGAGAAGIRTAIELKKHNVKCLILSKRPHGDAHTVCAAGGINASLRTHDPEDRWEIHAADTLREGHFINDPKAVEIVCRSAPDAIKELKEWGCPFETTDDGRIEQRYFGAQSYRRTCFVGDTTGRSILETLVAKAKDMNIAYRDGIFVFKILKKGDRVSGVLALDEASGKIICYKAGAVVVAAGGHASVYKTSSSRGDENIGDGSILAYEAGATLMDMELIQFHPTGMVKPEERRGDLVTEAVRGEGGRLFNVKKERFMERYSPDKMELDARDEVARSIAFELRDGNGTEAGGVYLDISHEDPEMVKERLPDMVQRFEKLGIDITKEAMEVGPTSHYSMGGVKVDFSTGETGVEGLYAVGETTAGLHGANRLGGNSLMETIVLGKLTGEKLVTSVPELTTDLQAEEAEQELEGLMGMEHLTDPSAVLNEAREIMERHAGIIRSKNELEKGLQALEDLKSNAGREKIARPGELRKALEVEVVLQIGRMIFKAALMREESRGAHYREDFKETQDEWKKNILCRKGRDGDIELSTTAPGEVSEGIKKALDEDHHFDHHLLE